MYVLGTKIVYEKSLLLHLRNSPISKTPPNYNIPEYIQIGSPNKNSHFDNRKVPKKQQFSQKCAKKTDEDAQFEMDL